MTRLNRGKLALLIDSRQRTLLLHRQGLTVAEIAACRNIHPRTVRGHLSSASDVQRDGDSSHVAVVPRQLRLKL